MSINEQKMFQVDFDLPQSNNVCSTSVAWAQVPTEPSAAERDALIARIKALLIEKKALLVAHYYVHPDLQDLAEATGGIVSDSLEMARFGRDHPAQGCRRAAPPSAPQGLPGGRRDPRNRHGHFLRDPHRRGDARQRQPVQGGASRSTPSLGCHWGSAATPSATRGG